LTVVAQPRATWKGYLKIAELSCPIALYAAASSSERIALHTISRETHHRLRRQFVDSATGKPVEREDQAKGYEVGKDEYVMLEPEDIESAVPQNDKTLLVAAFVDHAAVDEVYFDRPYYLTGSDRGADAAFALIRDGLKSSKTVAIAKGSLFRRARTMLIRPCGSGLAASTLNYDYEVRSAAEAFSTIPDITIKGEMLDLARHIIDTKRGDFDPRTFHDRYEAALANLVKAKLEGRKIELPERAKPKPTADVLAALRESAMIGAKPRAPSKAKAAPRRPASRRKAS
jgi:DNA end-binding protein Ku